jgi:hypothetical protein
MRVFEITYAYRPINVPPNLVTHSTKETTIVVADDMNEAAYEFFTDLRLDKMILNDVQIIERRAGFIQAPVFDGPNAVGDKANYARERATRVEPVVDAKAVIAEAEGNLARAAERDN